MPGYAIYRLPHETHATLVQQTEGEPAELLSCTELNGKRGFVVAPFEVRNDQPILLIRPDIVKRIPDLMHDDQRDQDIRRLIAVNMGVQVCAELGFAADVGLNNCFFDTQAVVLGLAHQGLGDGRHGGLHLDPAVREDVRHLRIAQPENVHQAVVPVVVAGNLAPDHQQSLVAGFRFQAAQPGQVPDQVAGMMVRRTDLMEQAVFLHVEVDHDVLLPVQKELLKKDHFSTSESQQGVRRCNLLRCHSERSEESPVH